MQLMPQKEKLFTAGLLLAWVIQFLHATAIHLQLHLPGFLQELGGGEAYIGQTSAAFSIAALVSYPVVGWLMDWKGRRVIIIAGGVLHILVASLHLTLDSLGPWVYVVRSLYGICEAMLFASLIAFAADTVPTSRRTEGLALFGLAGLLPIAFSGFLGDWIGDYRQIFIAQMSLAAIALAASVGLWENTGLRLNRKGGASFHGFFSVAARRDLLPIWFVGVVFAASLTPVFSFLKTLVLEREIGSVGGFMTGYVVIAAMTRVFGGRLPDRVGMKRMLVPALWVLGLGLWALANAQTAWGFVVAGGLCGFGHGFAFPIGLSMAVSRAPAESRGGAVAIYTAVFPLGMLLAPPLGILIEALGYTWAFSLVALLPTTGSILFLLWDGKVKTSLSPLNQMDSTPIPESLVPPPR